MAKQSKELILLMEQNLIVLNWLHNRLNARVGELPLPKTSIMVLVKLTLDGPAKLKDMARGLEMSTPALCQIFRALEGAGLINRKIDDCDRRDTWYSLTESGVAYVRGIKKVIYDRISGLLVGISREDEAALSGGLKQINTVLNKIKDQS
ncbi:MAG: MarR family transcriptional regulator [Rickettsiales bacterium]|jgi:DNA-binding MarR family transcriptional regulator|nr:MarR family transcriptional regulator [Rickettsiales bacterium]